MHGSAQPEALTPIEASAALKALMDSPGDLKRLFAYGRRLSFSGMKPDDLVQEAMTRVLGGERSCPRNVSIVQVLKGTMRSIANGWFRKQKRLPVLELVPSHGGDQVDDAEGVEPVTPEQILQAKQGLAAVRALFDADEVAKTVFEGVAAGFEGEDLCELAGIDSSQLATVRKRISRRLQSAFPNGSRT